MTAQPSHPFSRRRFLQAAAVTGAAAAVSTGWEGLPATAHGAAGKGAKFPDLTAAVRPRFRWWWPDGLVDPKEIAREIDQIADAGFGGAEIAGVHHSVADKSVLDTAHHGWGSASWIAGVEAALERADRRGLVIDLTLGPAWPSAVPTITADNGAASRELAYGAVLVAAGQTYTGPVPAPVIAHETEHTLRGVNAFRVNAANTTKKETGLEEATATDLTGSVSGGNLTWTAPADGDWYLFSYWERGSAQQPESGPHTATPAYVVDHFSQAGTKALIAYWEKDLLTPRMRKLLRRVGGTLFEDSFELETEALQWTANIPQEFRKRRGYDLFPVLPAILLAKENTVFAFEAVRTRQIRHDYWETVSELFDENHFTPLRDWAHGLGMKLRAQPYGLNTDAIATSAILDNTEGESLGFKNLDDYRVLAGGRDMGGHTVMSSEAGAYQGGAYATPWKKILRTMSGAYAAGLNQTYIHGFSYATIPGVNWPGFAAFTPYGGKVGYSESWGPRQPAWTHTRDVADYLARVHAVTQAGRMRADIAVFRQTGYSKTGLGATWFTATGIPLGWTHQFISEPILALKSAKVRGGRFAPDGPAYKAIVIEGDKFYSSAPTVSVEVAEKFLGYADAGLPIVFIGDWSAATTSGVAIGTEAARLGTLLGRLFAHPKVRNVTAADGVPGALAALGVTPDASYPTSSLLNLRRVEDDMDLYYLANGKHADSAKGVVAIDHAVTLTRGDRRRVPFLLDLWTGEIRRVAQYSESGDTVTFRVALQVNDTVAVVFARPERFGEGGKGNGKDAYATATTADAVFFDGSRLAVRAKAAGTYTTTLSTGKTVTSKIGEVPAEIVPAAWTLDVESWLPGATATETVKEKVRVSLTALTAWSAIPELQDVSGVGRYTTTVELPKTWSADHGAVLSLGEVFDTARVIVNGKALPAVNVITPALDVSAHLRPGRNTLVVEVTTTLNNRLRLADPGVYGGNARQAYGITGPVRLTPYRTARL
ncbi:secreted protein [Actinocorallia herbida]|uniref:Secreted protein n=1 Tax=Actinocorallia herbida TaxID=58109 RepID=A0A3N1D563_9ACTN|nr:glycosyl hydrolase [Actinocorallia herbida]ROO88681.1 secreted protein [Actinocorallia herbida]